DLARQLGLTTTIISSLSDWKNTESFITSIKKECDRLWAESPDVKEQFKKLKKRAETNSLKSQYENQYQNFNLRKKELQDFEQENGNVDEIDNKIVKTTKRIEGIDKEIKRVNSKAKLVEEGIFV
ncbi:unnamed protein product, partial [marine sediment metagenome]